MALSDKVSRLETDAVTASRLAEFWRKQIEVYGEVKATAFYKSLGLNHLETKSVSWEGMTLSREPTEVEKLCIKSISQAQDAGKSSLAKILLQARSDLIAEALTAIKKLTPATYHELILTMPDKYHAEVRDQLAKVFVKGRKLVATELAAQSGKSYSGVDIKQSDDEDSELDDFTDLTDSRVANDIQSRITAAASRFALLGLTGKALWDAVEKEVGDGSTGWLDRIATGAANKVLNMGRAAEAEDRKDEWEKIEYSAILDSNVCEPCAADDGQTSTNEDDLTPAPNPDCVGGDWCRCFHVFLTQ